MLILRHLRSRSRSSVPANASAFTRDPALWPFLWYSPWNYPLGTGATTATPSLPGGGRWTQGRLAYTQFTGRVWIAQNSDPTTTITRSDRDSDQSSTPGAVNGVRDATGNGLYTSNKFTLRHCPSNAAPSNGTDAEMSVITPDHLTAMCLSGVTGSQAAGFATTNGGGSTNVDLKGPGWGPMYNPSSWAGIGLMGIWTGSGDEADTSLSSACPIWGTGPFPSFPPPNGTSIPTDGVVSSGGNGKLSGLIRDGELTHGTLGLGYIAHTLVLAADPHDNTSSWVWPAIGADGIGSGGNTSTGTLVCLPRSFSVAGLSTPQGQMVAQALMDYGGYIFDSAGNGQGVITIYADQNITDSGPGTTNFNNDLNTIAASILVVTNGHHSGGGPPAGYGTQNDTLGIKLDGGGGTLYRGLAPAFDR